MELDARRMNMALHLRCLAVFMRRTSRAICCSHRDSMYLYGCSHENPISRYVFVWCSSWQEKLRVLRQTRPECQKRNGSSTGNQERDMVQQGLVLTPPLDLTPWKGQWSIAADGNCQWSLWWRGQALLDQNDLEHSSVVCEGHVKWRV